MSLLIQEQKGLGEKLQSQKTNDWDVCKLIPGTQFLQKGKAIVRDRAKKEREEGGWVGQVDGTPGLRSELLLEELCTSENPAPHTGFPCLLMAEF